MTNIFDLMTRYVCSRCWGHLICVDGDVVCARSTIGKCNGKNYVTKHWAEQCRSNSWTELHEVKENYPHLVPQVKQSNASILAELGY